MYAAAMPGGEQRKANLEMLVEKAMEYESTSYRGLFNFIRYLEQLQKYQVDFGEVNIAGENENTVRIMSIHKSKGLEFPVVFAAGMGKTFNMMDANAGLVLHPELGIGMQGIEPELRIKMPTLMRQVIQKQIRLENLGEELRVLYVALTRAKEKLILTGSHKNLQRCLEGLHSLLGRKEKRLPYGMLEGAQEYWGWVLPVLARHPALTKWYRDREMGGSDGEFYSSQEIPLTFQTVRAADLVGKEMKRQILGETRYQEYSQWEGKEKLILSWRKNWRSVFRMFIRMHICRKFPEKSACQI